MGLTTSKTGTSPITQYRQTIGMSSLNHRGVNESMIHHPASPLDGRNGHQDDSNVAGLVGSQPQMSLVSMVPHLMQPSMTPSHAPFPLAHFADAANAPNANDNRRNNSRAILVDPARDQPRVIPPPPQLGNVPTNNNDVPRHEFLIRTIEAALEISDMVTDSFPLVPEDYETEDQLSDYTQRML